MKWRGKSLVDFVTYFVEIVFVCVYVCCMYRCVCVCVCVWGCNSSISIIFGQGKPWPSRRPQTATSLWFIINREMNSIFSVDVDYVFGHSFSIWSFNVTKYFMFAHEQRGESIFIQMWMWARALTKVHKYRHESATSFDRVSCAIGLSFMPKYFPFAEYQFWFHNIRSECGCFRHTGHNYVMLINIPTFFIIKIFLFWKAIFFSWWMEMRRYKHSVRVRRFPGRISH